MKKKILLFALVAIMALSAVSVSASSLKPIYPTNDSYSFTYNVDAENATEQYGMIVVAGTPDEGLDMNDILYIGQAAADKDGNIEFKNFAPMGEAPSDYEGSDKGDGDGVYFKECTVFIGGKGISDGEGDAAKAQAIGILKNASGVPVTGKVVDTFSSRGAAVTIYDGADILGSSATASDGSFSLTIGGGENLTITITKDAYLTYTLTGVNVTDAVELGEIEISDCAGDVDGNTFIEFADLQLVLGLYNKSSDTTADIDKNGYVEFADLQAILGAYNKGNADRTFEYTPAQ